MFRKIDAKRTQHEDFSGGHPSQYYSRPCALNFGVLMGSGALVLVWSNPLTCSSILYLSHLGHTSFSSDLRFSNITRPNVDLFDETITEAAHLGNQCEANKKPRRNTYEKLKNTKVGPLCFGEQTQKERNTRTSQEVTHPSTTLAHARLTSVF